MKKTEPPESSAEKKTRSMKADTGAHPVPPSPQQKKKQGSDGPEVPEPEQLPDLNSYSAEDGMKISII